MSREKVHVLHKLRFVLPCRRAAHAAAPRDLDAGRPPLKGPEHQLVSFGEIKARPVELVERRIDQRRDVGEIGDEMRHAVDQALGLGDQRGIIGFLHLAAPLFFG